MDRSLITECSDVDLESILRSARNQLDRENRQQPGSRTRQIEIVRKCLSDPRGDWNYLATSVAATDEAKAEVMTEIIACYTAGMEVQAGRRDQADEWTPCESVPENFFDYVFRVR